MSGTGAIARVQAAWAACITAEMAAAVGLAVVAYRLVGLGGVALVGLSRTIPAAVLGPFVASVADRWPRGAVLLGVLAVRSMLFAGLATTVRVDVPTGIVFALSAVDAVVYSAWWPAQSAILPVLARTPNEATSANVATTVVENVGGLAGPLLGAGMLAIAGVDGVFVVGGCLLAIGAFVMVPLRTAGSVVAPVAHGGRESRDGGTLAGFAVSFRERHPRTVIGLYLLQTFGLGMLGVLIVATALERLEMGEAGIGVLQAAMGAGGVAGAFASLTLVGRRSLARALGAALAVWALAAVGMGAVPWVAAALVGLFAIGIANAVVDVSALTLLQRVVREAFLVRVLGVFEGLWWAMLGLGGVAGAALADQIGIGGALCATGVLLVAGVVAAWRGLRDVDRVAGPPQAFLDAVRSVPFLGVLPQPAIERLAFGAEPSESPSGTPIITAGELGDEFFILVEGEVEVTTGDRVRRLVAPAWFGEIALLHDVPRTATVTAVSSIRVVILQRRSFLAALRLDPALHASIARQGHALRTETEP